MIALADFSQSVRTCTERLAQLRCRTGDLLRTAVTPRKRGERHEADRALKEIPNRACSRAIARLVIEFFPADYLDDPRTNNPTSLFGLVAAYAMAQGNGECGTLFTEWRRNRHACSTNRAPAIAPRPIPRGVRRPIGTKRRLGLGRR